MDTKATILWHDLWSNGPIIGVCEYKNEKIIFSRNGEGKYDLRRFKEGGYKKAEQDHFSYRATFGGHRDHDPKMSGPHIYNQCSKNLVFDYVENGINEIIDTLDEKDFKWFHPPKKHISETYKRAESNFNPDEIDGDDIQDDSSDEESNGLVSS